MQKSGEVVRVTVQLIQAANDSHLWAETYDRNMSDVFGVETDVAQKIAAALEAKLTGREKKQIASVGTNNPAAYDAVLHGIALRASQSSEDVEKERGFFQRAVELDPNYAQAWAYLGAAELQLYPSPEQSEKARHAIETALRLAPDLEDGHVAMGVYKYYSVQDFDGAVAEFDRAREQEPNDSAALYFTALVQRRQGKLDDAIRGMQQAATLDPLNQDMLVNLGTTYRGMRKIEEARAMFDHALAIAPNDPNILATRAETYLAQGDLDAAWGIVSKLKLSPNDITFRVYMSILAQRRQFDQMLAEVQGILAKKQDYPPFIQQTAHAVTASLYLMKGDRAAALPYAERARRDRENQRSQKSIIPVFFNFSIAMEALLGNRPEVEREIEELFDKTRNDKWEFPNSETTAAEGYILLGDIDRALPLLQDALSKASADSVTPSYLRLEPFWDGARRDPRFQKLIPQDEAKSVEKKP